MTWAALVAFLIAATLGADGARAASNAASAMLSQFGLVLLLGPGDRRGRWGDVHRDPRIRPEIDGSRST